MKSKIVLLPIVVVFAQVLLPLFLQSQFSKADIPRACTDNFKQLPFCDQTLKIDDRVEDLVQRLDLHEKALLLTARASPRGNVPRIGLPEYNWGANCVHGVQSTCGTNCATSFPNPVNLGAIFDPKIVHKMAQVIGWELRALWLEGSRENYKRGPHLGLDCWSPNININRDPRWGRNMETPSEDPLVNSLYGVAYTKGLQEGKDSRYLQAVVTLKHWIAYSYEHYGGVDRMEFDAVVSRYDFADTYFPAFRASIVDGKAKGIMCSYNRLNGIPTCSNSFLNRLLRQDLNFSGYMTSDSGAIEAIFRKHNFTKDYCEAATISINNGTDINSGSVYLKCLEKLVKAARLSENDIDDAIRRTLKLRFELGLFDPIESQPYWNVTPSEVNTPASRNLSLQATRQSLVLLQNKNKTLPLKTKIKLAVIGPHAEARESMMGNYYGQICHGDYHELGCVQSPLDAIRAKNGDDFTFFTRGCDVNTTSTEGFEKAAALVQAADATVLFLGIDTSIEREAYDRENIELPAIQLQLLKRIRKIGKPTVVVLFNGGALGLEEVILNCDSIIEAFYPGFFGGQAIADTLFGDNVPSGKLPITSYHSSYVKSVEMASMSMTKYPGRSYRYYKEVPVFPFGWGLSYTRFAFLKIHSDENQLILAQGKTALVRIKVMNVGSYTGDEVVFAYFKALSINASGPVSLLNQQLFSFQRMTLRPGEVEVASFAVHEESIALYDEEGNLCLFPGLYQVILSNGVEERVTFPLRLEGKKRVLRPFPRGVFGTKKVTSDVAEIE